MPKEEEIKKTEEEKKTPNGEEIKKTKEEENINPNDAENKGEEKPKEKSLEEEVMEMQDKQYLAKIIVDTQKELSELKTLLTQMVQNKGTNPLLNSQATGEINNEVPKQKSPLDEIIERNKGK